MSEAVHRRIAHTTSSCMAVRLAGWPRPCRQPDLGSRVLVAEPYLHIGGMMAAGLTRTDLGDAKTTGGLCREFFERMAKYYDSRGVKRERYYDFEPHVAGIIWREMTQRNRAR